MRLSKTTIKWSLGVVVGLIVVVAGTAWAQQQQGGGQGRGGGMQNMIYLDRAWTVVCFGLEATPEQIEKLQPTFQTAWQTRTDALKTMMASQDRQAAMQEYLTALQQIKQDLDTKLSEVLTAEQLKQGEALLSLGQGRPGGQQR